MSISKRIAAAIDELGRNDPEAAFYPLFSAIEATANKVYGKRSAGGGTGPENFRRLIGDNMNLITKAAFGSATIGAVNVKYDINRSRPDMKPIPPDKNGHFSVKQVLYHVARCCHAHEAELPSDFSFQKGSTFRVRSTGLVIPSELLFGTIAMLITCPQNENGRIDGRYSIMINGKTMTLNDWWGKRAEFEALLWGNEAG